MTPKLVYVAGPYTAPTRWDQENHVRRAEEAALQIATMGHVPVCPHTMYRHFDGTLDAATWYRYTLELLLRCDAIYLLDGWERSVGAVREEHAARQHGIVVLSRPIEILVWFNAQAQSSAGDSPADPVSPARESAARTVE